MIDASVSLEQMTTPSKTSSSSRFARDLQADRGDDDEDDDDEDEEDEEEDDWAAVKVATAVNHLSFNFPWTVIVWSRLELP